MGANVIDKRKSLVSLETMENICREIANDREFFDKIANEMRDENPELWESLERFMERSKNPDCIIAILAFYVAVQDQRRFNLLLKDSLPER